MVTKADEKWDEIGDNPLVITSEITRLMSAAREKWVEEVDTFLQDEDVLHVLNLTTKIIAGEIPSPEKLPVLLARLSAASLKFRTQFSGYMSYNKGTTEANMKKNHYKELYTGIDRLVDALKYVAK